MNPPAPDPVPPSRQDFVFWPGDNSPLGEEATEALRDTVAKLTGERPEVPEEDEPVPSDSLPPPPAKWQRSTSFGWRDEPRWWEVDFVKEEQGASGVPPSSMPKLVPGAAGKPSLPVNASARPTPPTKESEAVPSVPSPVSPSSPKPEAHPSRPPSDTPLLFAPPPRASVDTRSVLERAAADLLESKQTVQPLATPASQLAGGGSFLPPPRKKSEAPPPLEAVELVGSSSAPETPGFAEALLLPVAPSIPAETEEKHERPETLVPPTVPVLSRRPGLPNARRVGGPLPAEERIMPHPPTKLTEAEREEPMPHSRLGGGRWFWWLLLLGLAVAAALLWINRERLPPAWREWLPLPASTEPSPAASRGTVQTASATPVEHSSPNGAAAEVASRLSQFSNSDSSRSSPLSAEQTNHEMASAVEEKTAQTVALGASKVMPASEPMLAATKEASSGGSGKAAAALPVVQSVVSAAQLEKLLPWVQDTESLAPLIQGYYKTQPLRPLENAQIEFVHDGVTSDGTPIVLFHVRHSGCAAGFPVSVEETREGWRLDWQSYVQWRDEWLKKFALNQVEESQLLFVVLRRTHYFNDDVPNLDGKLAFRVTSAVPDDEGLVAFVEQESELGRELDAAYQWRKAYFPVVELQWVREGESAKFVRLNRVVRPTWRRVE